MGPSRLQCGQAGFRFVKCKLLRRHHPYNTALFEEAENKKTQLEQVFSQAASSARFKDAMEKQGAVARLLGAAATDKLIRTELAAMTDVAREAGIQRKAP